MLKTAQLVLPLMLCACLGSYAQSGRERPARGKRSASPPALKSPAQGTAGEGAGARPARSGLRGARSTDATSGDVTVTGGKGDVPTGIAPVNLLGLPQLMNAMGVPSGTPIHVRLLAPIDSGRAKNGDTVDAVLTEPLGKAATGAPVTLTVVAVAAAGTMTSAGEISLQVIRVNGENMLSSVITAQGAQGTALQPDGQPARGTEASFTPDTPISLPAA